MSSPRYFIIFGEKLEVYLEVVHIYNFSSGFNNSNLSKCGKKNLKYFTLYVLNERLVYDEEHKPISSIYTFKVYNEIKSIDITGDLCNKDYKILNVCLELRYHCVYEAQTGFYASEKITRRIIQIKLPCYLHGFFAEQLLDSKRLSCRAYVEDLCVRPMDAKTITVSGCVILAAYVSPGYAFAYALANHQGHNVYVSYDNGAKFLQKTFFTGHTFQKIEWCPIKNEIGILSDDNMYTLNLNNKNRVKINTEMLKDISDFTYGFESDIFAIARNETTWQIFKINPHMVTQLTNFPEEKAENKYSNLRYCHMRKEIYFISSGNGKDSIFRLSDDDLSSDILFEEEKISEYAVNHEGLFLAVAVEGEDMRNDVVFVYMRENEKKKLRLPVEGGSFTYKIRFVPHNESLIVLAVNHNKRDDLILYDIKNDTGVNITKHSISTSISDFSFDGTGERIIYAANNWGQLALYELEMYGYRRKVFINCLAKSINIAYKGDGFFEWI